MKTDLSLIVAGASQLPVFSLTADAKQLKANALEKAALIGRVTNSEENTRAVNAQRDLKAVQVGFEKQRKKLKEPLLEAGRQLDRTVNEEVDEIDREMGRIAQLTGEFQLAEQRRVREEEELQRRELARIEAEKQAELKRIEEERLRSEREAREAQEAADKAAREAKTKKERLEAERIAAEAEAKRLEAERATALAAQQAAKVEETAAAQTYVESRPIQTTRESGQIVNNDWEIEITNPYELAKYHPDCVKITPLLTPIKAALNDGREVKGVKAKKVITSNVRASRVPALIEV